MTLFAEKVRVDKLKAWAFDYAYRCDAGLAELEAEYRRKKIPKKVSADRTYLQLQGKLHAVLMLLRDFQIPFVFSPRLQHRVTKQHGAKLNEFA